MCKRTVLVMILVCFLAVIACSAAFAGAEEFVNSIGD
jgi:hypothetical protein